VGELRPGQVDQFLARVTQDFAQTVVETQPAQVVRREDGHANEGEIEEEPEQAILLHALGGQLELVRS
jgi:hypothetical protein